MFYISRLPRRYNLYTHKRKQITTQKPSNLKTIEFFLLRPKLMTLREDTLFHFPLQHTHLVSKTHPIVYYIYLVCMYIYICTKLPVLISKESSFNPPIPFFPFYSSLSWKQRREERSDFQMDFRSLLAVDFSLMFSPPLVRGVNKR